MSQVITIGRHATTVATVDGKTRVTYHNTVVVEFDAETIRLNSGGWRTVTTKTRMNQAANQFGLGYEVFQKDFDWFVRLGRNSLVRDFADNMVIDRRTLEV